MKIKEFIEKYHDKYSEYYIAIYIWGHHDNLAPDYIGEFSRKLEYIKYWDEEIESVNQTPTRINLFLAFLEKKDTKLIKIKVNDEDRSTLSSMLDYAVTASEQCASEFEDLRKHYLDINQKFKDLRQRVVYEELEDESKNTCETE